mgnify:CR=1 FL=1
MKDYIFINELKVPIRIGCFEEEREKLQEIAINIKIFSDTRKAAISKNIKDTVCYKTVTELARSLANENSYVLLEEFAELVIASIFKKYEIVNVIEISLTKFVIPEAKGVGVSMVRMRD